ncbi:MAG: SpaH/EbpB family LPXTG-anchored major pilin [[Clostridium] spiroforme]|uniref:SpaH/EbpB family LPXTG-anchored major pilin n=1 Tax=Thomasclavelia spiroformis TaxID=29348 RepID=A0A943I4J0_9FIRM|nr:MULTISPECIES: SpaH/EbpB family LPXTG-anchored major pilin [Thomasclavelia]MBS5588757.1 SpaH/EbpB family LPXTG-anchored major pilin [Thomasclavelia spiroformis]
MKTVKKIFSLMLVFLVGFALTLPANASDKVDPKDNPDIDLNTTTGNITIQKRGSIFSIYKILNAEAKAGQNVYNYTVNKDFDGLIGKKEDGKKYSLKDIADMPNQLHINKYDNGKIESVIDPITELTSNFTSAVQTFIDTNNIQPTKTIQCPDVDGEGAKATASDLELGFYIIIETGTTSSSASVSSRSMLVPLPYVDGNAWNFDLKITPKDEPVNVDKSIIEDGEKENVSTNNVGDVLDYQVEADIPHYDASTDLASVKYIITDSLSKGLDFAALLSDVAENKKEVVITVDDLNSKSEPVRLVEGEDYTISYSASENGENKVMTINFVYSKIINYYSLQLNYSVRINKDAVIGVAGNPNQVDLEYTNNNKTWETSKPGDETKSFVFGLKINKVDSAVDKQALQGAEFQLLKDGTPIATYTFGENGDRVLNSNGGLTAVTNENGVAYLLGIDEGTYTLKETKAPNGYILPEEGLELVITDADEKGNVDGKATYTLNGKELTVFEDIADGSVATTTIENNKGFNLPRTGGAGTWMFAVGGILIMAGMATAFVKLRKKEN